MQFGDAARGMDHVIPKRIGRRENGGQDNEESFEGPHYRGLFGVWESWDEMAINSITLANSKARKNDPRNINASYISQTLQPYCIRRVLKHCILRMVKSYLETKNQPHLQFT